MRIKSLIMLSVVLLAAAMSPAQDAVINSGGTVRADFIDAKGTPVIGRQVADNGTVIEIGPIYVLVGVPAGTVPLQISKDGANIALTWATGDRIDLYVLTGPGTGIFSNTAGWSLLAGGSTGGTYTDSDQVGAGDGERYYKALVAGTNPAADHPDGDTYISRAPAVGKVNVLLRGSANRQGKNLISVPFQSQPSATVANVFGEGSGSVWTAGDRINKKNRASPAYLTAVYMENSWRNAANPAGAPAFDIDPRFGNEIIVKADKSITLVGGVINDLQEVAVFGKENLPTGGKTLLGMLYPRSFGLAAANLISGANAALAGDLIQVKLNPLNESYVSAVVIDGEWKNAANPSVALDARIATLILPNSYLFVRLGNNSGFIWRRARPD